MKIASKISVGFVILIALIVAVLAYQISLFSQMQSINRDLSGIDFRSAIVSLQLLRDLDQMEEFTRKFFATRGDPDYATRLGEMGESFAQRLQSLASSRESPAEKSEVGRLSQLWTEYMRSASNRERKFDWKNREQVEFGLEDQLGILGRLRDQDLTVFRETQRSIESRVEQSSAAAIHAQRISWVAAGAALLLSLGVAFWIIRSISKPLRFLKEGTRAVAAGKFFYQLDTSQNDELAQLARDFNLMTRRLNELDNLKKDFVSHVSHELKTPLASIEETNRLLLEEIPGPLNAQQKRFLELSLQSGKRLSAMIRNLLDLSRMDAGVMQYEMKKNDLAAILKTVLEEFEAPLREKSIQVETELPPGPLTVHCDRDRTIQVLGNLLGNALKFSPRGSVLKASLVRVQDIPQSLPEVWRERLPTTKSPEGYLLLSIADSGPGIPLAEKERIFEKFHQVRRVSKTPGQDSGLGLAISRTIVEAHRGAIWVDDNPGGGSVFHVLLASGAVHESATMRTSTPI